MVFIVGLFLIIEVVVVDKLEKEKVFVFGGGDMGGMDF